VFRVRRGLGRRAVERSVLLFQRIRRRGRSRCSRGIGVPADKWLGQVAASSAEMVTRSPCRRAPSRPWASSPPRSRRELGAAHVLGLPGLGSDLRLLPDSTSPPPTRERAPTATTPSGSAHLLTTVDASGYPTDPEARTSSPTSPHQDPPGGFDLISLARQGQHPPAVRDAVGPPPTGRALLVPARALVAGCY